MKKELTHEEKEIQFIQDLRDAGLELAPDAVARIFTDYIYVYSGRPSIVSEVTISLSGGLFEREYYINHGTSVGYTPSDDNVFWRTIHAAEILKNWYKVIEICEKYRV